MQEEGRTQIICQHHKKQRYLKFQIYLWKQKLFFSSKIEYNLEIMFKNALWHQAKRLAEVSDNKCISYVAAQGKPHTMFATSNTKA